MSISTYRILALLIDLSCIYGSVFKLDKIRHRFRSLSEQNLKNFELIKKVQFSHNVSPILYFVISG